MNCYLGIDVGTSGCRACLIDADGDIRAEAAVDLPAPLARDGGREQDAELWWQGLEQLLEMGMEDGTVSAMAQIDDALADLESFAAGRGTDLRVLSDTQIRVSRVIRGSVEQVWAAHHDADLMRRWMLGPDGWTMPVCEVATAAGDSYRYQWESEDGDGEPFGFEGEVLESQPPHREVSTERMIGMDAPATTNELTLVPRGDATLMTVVITYASSEIRDAVLGSGMVDGMEASYARLEAVLA